MGTVSFDTGTHNIHVKLSSRSLKKNVVEPTRNPIKMKSKIEVQTIQIINNNSRRLHVVRCQRLPGADGLSSSAIYWLLSSVYREEYHRNHEFRHSGVFVKFVLLKISKIHSLLVYRTEHITSITSDRFLCRHALYGQDCIPTGFLGIFVHDLTLNLIPRGPGAQNKLKTLTVPGWSSVNNKIKHIQTARGCKLLTMSNPFKYQLSCVSRHLSIENQA